MLSSPAAESGPGAEATDIVDLSSHPHVRGHDWRVVKYTLIVSALLLAAAVAAFVYGLYGPNPPVKFPSEIDGRPLTFRADGTPDLGRYVLDLSREGVTPENNAAIPFLRAMLPLGELKDPKDLAAVCAALGMEVPEPLPMPTPGEEYSKAVAEAESMPPQRTGPAATIPPPGGSDRSILYRPWTARELPQTAKLIEADAARFALLAEAAGRSRFWLPSPSILKGEPDSPWESSFLTIQPFRNTARWLSVAAMYELGRDQPDKAWDHVHTSLRLAKLCSSGQTVIESLVAKATYDIGFDVTLQLMTEPGLELSLLERIQKDLGRLDAKLSMVDQSAREMPIDLLTMVIESPNTDENIVQFFSIIDEVEPKVAFVSTTRLDWSDIFEIAEPVGARIAAIDDTSDREERHRRIQDLRANIEQFEAPSWTALLTSRAAREDLLAHFLMGMTTGSLDHFIELQERPQANLEVLRVAVALRRSVAGGGAYPTDLSAITPSFLPSLPDDPRGFGAIKYRRAPDGGCWVWSGEAKDAAPPSDAALDFAAGPNAAGDSDIVAIRLPAPPGETAN